MPAPSAPGRTKVILAFFAIYVIWGSTYLAIRYAVDTLPPFLMAGVRFVVAGGVLFALTARGRLEGVGWRQWGAATLVGACMFLGGNGLLSWAEQGVDSGVAALVIASIPVWLMLLEWMSGGNRPTRRAMAGVVLGVIGVAILVVPAQGSSAVRGGPLEFGALIVASISWSVGSLYMRRAPLPPHSGLTTSMQMLGGGVILLVVGTALGEWPDVHPTTVSLASALSLLYLIVFGSLIALSAYTFLIRATSPVLVGTYAFVNPVIAVLLGVVVAGETLNAHIAMAGAVIVAGVALVMSPKWEAWRKRTR
jgi:drug/metabolite transporter (DMT)-like permease